jgi:uncharacterized protein YjbJ (UPF0337 family)
MTTSDQVHGQWQQIKGKVKEKWGQLTDDDLTQISGNREQLEGKIRERYGHDEARVREDVDAFYREHGR